MVGPGFKDRYRAAFEGASDLLFLVDAAGRVLDTNRRALELAGVGKEDIIGRRVTRLPFFSPREARRVLKALLSSITGGPSILTMTITDAAGTERVLECSVSPVPTETAPEAVLIAARAVTGHRPVAATLHESEARYRTIFNEARDVIVQVDTGDTIVDVNPCVESMLGYTRDEVIGKRFTSLGVISRGLTRSLLVRIKEALATRKIQPVFEFELTARDGSKKTVEPNTTALLGDDGSITGFLCVLRDITERKKAEEALRESEGRLHNIIKSVPSFIAEFTLEGMIISLNKTQPGFTIEDFVGKSIYEVTFPEGLDDLKRAITTVKRTRRPVEYVAPDFGAHRTRAWYHHAVAPVLVDKKLVSLIIIVSDITERKKADNNLLQHLRSEEVLTTLSSRFVGMFDMDTAMADSLADIGTLGGADRCFLFTFDEDITRIERVHEWCAPGVPSSAEHWSNAPLERFKAVMKQVRKGQPLMISDAAKLPPWGQELKKGFAAVGTQAALILPIHVSGGLLGVLGLSYLDGPVEWGQYDLSLNQTCTDIIGNALERRRAEEELATEERFSTSLLDTMHDGVVMVNTKGELTYINPAFCRMTGFDEDELLGSRPPFPYWPKEDYERYMETFTRTVLKGTRTGDEFELTLRRKDGKRVHVLVTPTPMVDTDGKTSEWMDIIRDISERKKIMEDMRRQLMRFRLEAGQVYLVQEGVPMLSSEAFKDLLKTGSRGLVASRIPEKDFRTGVDGEFSFLWLTERREGHDMAPNIDTLERCIERLSRNSSVFIDRLDYLITRDGFEVTLSFVQRLRELAHLRNHIVVLCLDPATVDRRQRALMEKETRSVETRDMSGLPESLLEMLRYIHRQNVSGLKSTYADIGRTLGISKPTTRKRLRLLVARGYVLEREKGRCKVLELTDHGRQLLAI